MRDLVVGWVGWSAWALSLSIALSLLQSRLDAIPRWRKVELRDEITGRSERQPQP